jgi:hypothetical protein
VRTRASRKYALLKPSSIQQCLRMAQSDSPSIRMPQGMAKSPRAERPSILQALPHGHAVLCGCE